MKAFFSFVAALVLSLSMAAQNKSFYDFTVKTIDGKEYPLSGLKGKKVLVVNVASKCGLTPQYAELQELYDQYKDQNFVIIGFPANNFMGQEPGTNEEIAKFCSVNYDVTFPIMAKISVKGKDMAPLYHWLTEKKLNGVNSTLAVSNIRNRTYTDYEVYLIDYGYGNFKEKIHFME